MKSGNATVWRFQAKYRILPIKSGNRKQTLLRSGAVRAEAPHLRIPVIIISSPCDEKKNDTCHSDVHDLCKFPLNLSLGNAKKKALRY